MRKDSEVIMTTRRKKFREGDFVKHSEYYFEYMADVMKKLNASQEDVDKYERTEKELRFKIVELPAKYGSPKSAGLMQVEPTIDKSLIHVVSQREIKHA